MVNEPMGFKYQYETILKLEKQFEKIAEMKVHEKHTAMENATDQLRQLEAELEGTRSTALKMVQHNVAAYLGSNQTILRLERQIVQQKQVVEECRGELESALAEKKAKSVRVEAFETIKNQQQQAYIESTDRIERQEELESMIHRHASLGGSNRA